MTEIVLVYLVTLQCSKAQESNNNSTNMYRADVICPLPTTTRPPVAPANMKKPIETWKKLRTKLLDKYSTSLVYVYILLYRYMEDLISQASSIAHLLKSNSDRSTVSSDHWEDGLGAASNKLRGDVSNLVLIGCVCACSSSFVRC